jgi:ABC-type multidrug transport system fused ATPase/permease subunit
LPIADFGLGEALLTVAEIFLFVIWIWILFAVLSDLFRDHELSGWAKAAWIVLLVFVPYLGTLIYLIARGHGMRDRTIKAQAEAQQHFANYVRETAGSGSTVDELHKLDQLKDKGSISEEEFQRMKAKLIG